MPAAPLKSPQKPGLSAASIFFPSGSWDDCCEDDGCDWEQEERTQQQRDQFSLSRLCDTLALAIVLREPLVPATAAELRGALPAGVCACQLALLGEEGACLQRLPLLEQGRVASGPLTPSGVLGRDSAAWECVHEHRTLFCPRGCSTEPYSDWRTLVKVADADASALVTASLRGPNGTTIGAATFTLDCAPSNADQELLQQFSECLACAVGNATKTLWEVSLGFLLQVMPPRVVQRMLASALCMGPLAMPAAQARQAVAAADAAAATAALAPTTPSNGPLPLVSPALRAAANTSPMTAAVPAAKQDMGATEPSGRVASGVGAATATKCCMANGGGTQVGSLCTCGKAAVPATATFAAPQSPATAAAAAAAPVTGGFSGLMVAPLLGVAPGAQSWNLEFVDPTLEVAYRTWFNVSQAATDLVVFRGYAVMLLMLLVFLVARRDLDECAALLALQGLVSVAVPAAMVRLRPVWYIQHRSLVVGVARVAGAAVLLTHAMLHPGLCEGSLLRALCCSCVLTLAMNAFRNKVLFSHHLITALIKLYLCAVANSYLFSTPQLPSGHYLTLTSTTLVQLLAAAVPAALLYGVEGRSRTAFLTSRLRLAAAASGAVYGKD